MGKIEQKSETVAIAKKIVAGNRYALAKLITSIENETEIGYAVLEEIYCSTGKAHIIGITGAPGTGKSTLVNHLARVFRNPDSGTSRSVAIVAVDPSSPFTGGAILGDRVRMRDLMGDPGVFIRSMATRGSLGGIAATTSNVLLALDAAGYDLILVETVGAGQAEVDIARLAHTTIVVEAPGLGDEIQAIKAGILEIADLLVVNKADKPGVEITERALKSSLQIGYEKENKHNLEFIAQGIERSDITLKQQNLETWVPLIFKTVATRGQGIDELIKGIEAHFKYLNVKNELIQKEEIRLKSEIEILLREKLFTNFQQTIVKKKYHQILSKVLARKLTPWRAAEQLIDGVEK
jgi:LAO/AO transport system kinase